MNALTIRPAKPSDAKALLAFLNQVGGESDYLLFGENEITFTVEQESAWIQGCLDHPTSCFLLGLLDGELVATAGLSGFDRPRIAHRASVSVCVAKSHWGQGIARKMLLALIDYARSAGLSILELEVRTDNLAAIHLYESLGFQSFGVYKKNVLLNGVYYDCAYMTLEL